MSLFWLSCILVFYFTYFLLKFGTHLPGIHLSWDPFVSEPICPGTNFSGNHFFWTPIFLETIYSPKIIYYRISMSLFWLSRILVFYFTYFLLKFGTHLPGTHLSWDPLVSEPICPGTNFSGNHLSWDPFVQEPFVLGHIFRLPMESRYMWSIWSPYNETLITFVWNVVL